MTGTLVLIVAVVVATIAIWKHRQNIKAKAEADAKALIKSAEATAKKTVGEIAVKLTADTTEFKKAVDDAVAHAKAAAVESESLGLSKIKKVL